MKDELYKYAELFSTQEDDILKNLYRETNIKFINPRMISGHLQGKFLEMISKVSSPSRILEIGTFTGYSAICLAKGLKTGGILHTIEIDAELEDTALKFFSLSGLENQIIMHIGDAKNIIPEINEIFDIVFIDGDKESYPDYYALVFDKVRSGGLIIADNVLWGGKVLSEPSNKDKETKAIMKFNEIAKNDERVENFILPLRDGLNICIKK